VQMKDGLAGLGADVEDGAVAVFDLPIASNFGRRQMAASDDISLVFLRFFQSANMLFGNDQNVGRGFGIDVFEGEGVLVFVDFLRRNLAGDDFAEEAVHRNQWLVISGQLLVRDY